MSDIFREFIDGMNAGIVACPRCGEPCRAEKGSDEAGMLKAAESPADGLCANCAVASWLKASPFAEDAPALLGAMRKRGFQEVFIQLMKANNADMKPDEIDWGRVIRHWELPTGANDR